MRGSLLHKKRRFYADYSRWFEIKFDSFYASIKRFYTSSSCYIRNEEAEFAKLVACEIIIAMIPP